MINPVGSRPVDIEALTAGCAAVPIRHEHGFRRSTAMNRDVGTDHDLRCRSCEARYAPLDPPARCDRCGSRLIVAPDDVPAELPGPGARASLWRYADFLPTAGLDPIDLGGGWTPLVDLPTVAGTVGRDAGDVLLKNETVGPTWSWKDRLAALLVPHAVARGADRIATSTTGNHGAGIAAVAARAGIERIVVLLSPAADLPQRRRAASYGATVVQLSDPDASRAVLRDLYDRGWFVAYELPDRFTGQPYVYEAYATIAYEIVEQAGGVPDVVVVPVGSGDGLYGVWTGFRRLERAAITDQTPRMVGAEAAERQPLTRALNSGASTVGTDHGPEPASTSTMGPTSGEHALAAVRDSGGTAIAVERADMERALRAVGRDGTFLEPSSALAAGAAMAHLDTETPESIVILGTGAGLGWPTKTESALGDVTTVEASADAIEAVVDGGG